MNNIIRFVQSPRKGVASLGGPLVMLLAKDCLSWNPDLHYDAACQEEGWLGSLERMGLNGLVFWDEPAYTWWQSADGNRGAFFRSIYMPEGYVVSGEISFLVDAKIQTDVELGGGDFLLFDAALDGASALADNVGLSVSLPDGRVSIETYEYKPSHEVYLIAHIAKSCG